MLKKVRHLIAVLIIAGGIILVCYPSFASFINQWFANREISEYQNEMKDTSEEKLQETMQMAYEYNATLPGGYPADPFTGSNIANLKGTKFEDFWMVQPGAMLGYVEIPSINVYLPVYYGTSEEVLNEGAGTVVNTSLPVGGSGTHSVISAHTGMASKKLFTDLDLVKEGEIFFIHVLNQNFAYQVDQIKVVLPEETDDLYIEEGKDYVTLLTCTPFGINDHRLLVRGERIDYDFSQKTTGVVTPKATLNDYLWLYVLGIIIVLTIFVGFRRRKKQKSDKNKKQNEVE